MSSRVVATRSFIALGLFMVGDIMSTQKKSATYQIYGLVHGLRIFYGNAVSSAEKAVAVTFQAIQ